MVVGFEATGGFKRDLQWAWDKVHLAQLCIQNRIAHDCFVCWRYNRWIDIREKVFALHTWNDRIREVQMRTYYTTLLALKANMIGDLAKDEAVFQVNEAIRDEAAHDGAALPDPIVFWQFKNPSGVWEQFDRQTMYDIEFAHNSELLKVKVTPENDCLRISPKVKGTYLCIIHSRLMIDINTGQNYELQRSMPKIVYQVLEVGAIGPGDRATTGD